LGGVFFRLFALLGLEEFGADNFQCLFLVLGLGATVLALHLNAGREVGDLDCGVGGVDVLATRAT
jgi:hypothetical protein